jgi:RecB family exonuclease
LAAELQALAEKECLRAEALSPLGRRPLWPLRRRRLFAILSGWLTRELAKETSSTPLELEWSFGAGAADAAGPLELPLADGRSLFFKGRIDRIDESGAPGENRLLARDYKLRYRAAYEFDRQSGAPPPALYPAHLYALAASSALRRPAVSVMDFLNPMGGPAEHGGLGSDSPEMDLSLEVRAARKEAGLFSLPNRLEDIWRQARAGLFDPDSADGEPACDYCGFGLICPRADSGGEGEG